MKMHVKKKFHLTEKKVTLQIPIYIPSITGALLNSIFKQDSTCPCEQ